MQKAKAPLAGGTGCRLKAVIDICGHCTFRGIRVHSNHAQARVVVVKGARTGVTSSKSHTSHFASRLQEKQLQLEKKYDMEYEKMHDINEPYV